MYSTLNLFKNRPRFFSKELFLVCHVINPASSGVVRKSLGNYSEVS